MVVTDLFAGEIATELLKVLFEITRKSCLYRSQAESLMNSINELLPIIQEIKLSGVELPALRQKQLDQLSVKLRSGLELARKGVNSNRWNVYKNLQLARKMEKLEKDISRFISGPLQAHVLADVHHMRFEATERFDRLEQKLGSMSIGGGGNGVVKGVALEEDFMAVRWEGSSVNSIGVGVEVGKRKVKKMIIERDDLNVVGICGIGGCGKTTLAGEFCKDDQVRSYFQDRILVLTVSQSPNVEQLKAKICKFVMGCSGVGSFNSDFIPQWNNMQLHWRSINQPPRSLILLDDVWSVSALSELIVRVPGCKILVVSRFKFPTILDSIYEVELLKKEEATTLFCLSAFGQNSIPPSVNSSLVEEIVTECKGLPLALKVIGASLRDQPEIYWASAKKRLSRGEPICESHGNMLDRMAISVQFLSEKVRECFIDLGCFLEDMKIPLEVLVDVWVEVHDLEKEEALAIVVELSEKNLITVVKDPRAGDLYSGYYEISVIQHDTLRDLAIHMNNKGKVNERKRLLMPKRESELPKEWERNSDYPFNAQIVSIHTDEMNEMEWFPMEFPKAEVLIVNFTATSYVLPPFIDYMPNLRALIVMNHNSHTATIRNLSGFRLSGLKSIWLEKVSLDQPTTFTIPFTSLRKMSLVLCKNNSSLDQLILPEIFPSLTELTIDHCDDLSNLSTISNITSLKCLSITNCHNLHELSPDIGSLKLLRILRLYACPALKRLPPSICALQALKFLDISQCVNLKFLPESIGKLSRLDRIDMRECPCISSVPKSAAFFQSLQSVICDEEVYWSWKDIGKVDLHVIIADKCFSLDWLDE